MTHKLIMQVVATFFIIIVFVLVKIIPEIIRYRNAPENLKQKCDTGSICIQKPQFIH